MDVYTTEEQQIEAIKKWWHENKWSLIGGIVLGIAVIFGGRAWLENRNAFNETASAVYQNMSLQIAQGKFNEASQNGNLLLGDFSDTPYAALGALGMARIKLEQGDPGAAISHLRWALDNSSQEPVKHEARLRMGRLLLEQGKTDEALALLDGVDYGAFTPAYEQLIGDIHVAAGNPSLARDAYTRALAELSPSSFTRQILQMKLDELGGTAAIPVTGQGNNS